MGCMVWSRDPTGVGERGMRTKDCPGTWESLSFRRRIGQLVRAVESHLAAATRASVASGAKARHIGVLRAKPNEARGTNDRCRSAS